MAINPDTSRPNKNTLYLSASGGGKSQCLLQNRDIPKRGARVVGWDTNDDHAGHHYDNRAQFARALAKAHQSGKGFRIFYNGVDSLDAWEWWCACVFAILDGNRDTYVIAEELSAVCRHSGKASPNAARLMNQGRKYGMIFHGTSQKPQEISKTFYDQCERRYIGRQKGQRNIKLMAEECGVIQSSIAELKPLQFLYDDGGTHQPQLITLKYKPVSRAG